MKTLIRYTFIVFLVTTLVGCSSGDFEQEIAVKTNANQEQLTQDLEKYQEELTKIVEEPGKEQEISFWPVEPKEKLDTATVTKIIDGDTFEIKDGIVIRMIGINTPEIKDKNGDYSNPEFFAKEAKDFTEKSLLGKTVYLEVHKDQLFDKYKRVLAYVWLESPDDKLVGLFNALLVHEGYAKAMTISPHTRYSTLFEGFADDPERGKIGVWK